MLFAPHALAFDPAAARDALGASGPGTVLLCDEGFAGYPHTGGHVGALQKDRLERLRAVRPDTTVVMLIRRQADALLSLYGQYVRGGGTYSLRRYVGDDGSHETVPRFGLDQLDYLALYRFCAGLFGAARVHCYVYEAFAQEPRRFLASFASGLALDVDIDTVPLAPENPGSTVLALRAARVLNVLSRGAPDFKYYLMDFPGLRGAGGAAAAWLTRVLPGAPPRLPADLAAAVAQRFRASNRTLAALLGLDLAAFDYPT